MLWTCIHMLMHKAIGAELLQGKSCIRNVHAFVIWSCLGFIIVILMPWMMTYFVGFVSILI